MKKLRKVLSEFHSTLKKSQKACRLDRFVMIPSKATQPHKLRIYRLCTYILYYIIPTLFHLPEPCVTSLFGIAGLPKNLDTL